MAKSSHSTNFRKVNVDELDEERFQDDAGESTVSTGPTEGEIQNLLNAYPFLLITFYFRLYVH